MTDEIFEVFRHAINNSSKEEIDFLTADMSRYTDEDKFDILINATANAQTLDFYKYVISKGIDIYAKDEHQMTALHYAGYSSVPEIMDFLIRQGLDVNAIAEEKCTPLLYTAAHTSNPKVLELLITAGADIFAKDSTGIGVLSAAAGYNPHSEITSFLVNRGLDLDDTDNNGLTPIMNAALNNSSSDVITCLKNLGAEFYAKNPHGGTLLHLAAENPSVDVVTYLSVFFSVYDVDGSGFTPIELAACRNPNPEVLHEMLRIQRAENFFAAALNENPAIIDYMLRHGCDPNMENRKFNRPIFCVAQNNTNPDVMLALINAGAILSVKDLWGRNVAHYAAANKDTAMYDFLKEKYSNEIDFALVDEDGRTPEDYRANPDIFK